MYKKQTYKKITDPVFLSELILYSILPKSQPTVPFVR